MNNFLTTLLLCLNNSDVRDTNYFIAYGLLENLQELNDLTIQELAERSYVSVSAINRFIKNFGFTKYQIFKNTLITHVSVRKIQMLERADKKKYSQLEEITTLLKEKYNYDADYINNQIVTVCKLIKDKNRIVLIGSDEMISHTLRIQADFCVMGKLFLKNSTYKNNFIKTSPNDLVIIMSMNGIVFETNPEINESYGLKDNDVLTIGKFNFLNTSFLPIPEDLDETLENFLLDYYLQEIAYTYMRKYYDWKETELFTNDV